MENNIISIFFIILFTISIIIYVYENFDIEDKIIIYDFIFNSIFRFFLNIYWKINAILGYIVQ